MPVSEPSSVAEKHAKLVRAYQALVTMDDPPTYQVWTLAEQTLGIAGEALTEIERLREALRRIDGEVNYRMGWSWAKDIHAIATNALNAS